MRLNMEQRRIVELEPNGHMLVKGVAGSGKTTVSVRRIPFLLNHYCHEKDDKVLLVTFNKTLLNYIRYLYNKVEDEEQNQESFFGYQNKGVDITTIDSLMYKYFIKYQKNNGTNYSIGDRKVLFDAIIQAINVVDDRHPRIKLLTPKNANFLLDEITWIKACNINDVETYQNIDRIGRASGSKGMPQKLIKNSPVRAAIFELMTVYDTILENKDNIDYKGMNLLALKEAQQAPIEKYTHILIDESQDLTKVQLEFLRYIYNEKRYSSILFVADNTQSIYSHSWLGKGRPYTTIGYDMSGKSRTLSKNYRTTTEISTAAYDLIEHDESIKNNVDFVKPSLIDRQGHPPIYRYFKNTEKQMEFLFDEINILRNDYNYSDICIVAKEKRLIENALKYLDGKGLPCEVLNQQNPNFESDKVKLVTFHSIKGLEFKVIFLIDINEGVLPNTSLVDFDDEETYESEERKLLYVGMTRANELLYMTSVDKPSRFIKEIDNRHLRLKRDCSIRPFQSLGTYEYLLTDQIVDINSKEELIRQWFIRELKDTYGYPLELINLEYPVYHFSRKGYVDVVVSIFHKGDEIPYIFAEMKQFGTGIEEAREQLQSYMETNDLVRYGVVTDGLEIIIFNREDELLNDIPKCHPNFLPDLMERRLYINFRNNKRYSYAYDKDSTSNIEIADNESNLIIDFQSLSQIPLVGEVAAGIPQIAHEEYEHFLKIPNDWILSEKDTFALKVTGDSMNGIEIDRGDIVIVNKQNTAQNGDIVIAISNQEATMKKLMFMGDSVLLLSENPNYEPIQMKREDIIINGKVIGVLKG
ncbi:MAG: transcriptional repressor LexA [Tissierellaceae bacterium]